MYSRYSYVKIKKIFSKFIFQNFFLEFFSIKFWFKKSFFRLFQSFPGIIQNKFDHNDGPQPLALACSQIRQKNAKQTIKTRLNRGLYYSSTSELRVTRLKTLVSQLVKFTRSQDWLDGFLRFFAQTCARINDEAQQSPIFEKNFWGVRRGEKPPFLGVFGDFLENGSNDFDVILRVNSPQ